MFFRDCRNSKRFNNSTLLHFALKTGLGESFSGTLGYICLIKSLKIFPSKSNFKLPLLHNGDFIVVLWEYFIKVKKIESHIFRLLKIFDLWLHKICRNIAVGIRGITVKVIHGWWCFEKKNKSKFCTTYIKKLISYKQTKISQKMPGKSQGYI